MNAPALDHLLAEAAVTRLLARYASMTDWLDWEGVKTLFAEDATVDFGEMYSGGIAGFMPFVAALEGGYTRRLHHFGLPRIAVEGGRAEADCAAITHTRTRSATGFDDLVFYGRYRFGAALRGGDGWRLTRMTFYLNAVYPLASPESGVPVPLAEGFSPSHPDCPSG